MSIPEGTCGTCHFGQRWNRDVTGTYDNGLCMRFPPRVREGGRGSQFPRVLSTWWCGEYRRQEPDGF